MSSRFQTVLFRHISQPFNTITMLYTHAHAHARSQVFAETSLSGPDLLHELIHTPPSFSSRRAAFYLLCLSFLSAFLTFCFAIVVDTLWLEAFLLGYWFCGGSSWLFWLVSFVRGFEGVLAGRRGIEEEGYILLPKLRGLFS